MEITTKQELKELICSDKNKSGYYSKETTWKKIFTNFYIELLTWDFPDNFKFKQKVYHYLNDDRELTLGICHKCGKRCNLICIERGYFEYCSKRCGDTSEGKQLKFKQTCLTLFGVENPYQSEEIKNKVKMTCLTRYGKEYYTQTDEYKIRYKNTCLEKYGKECYFQIDEYKDKYKNPEWLTRKQEKEKQTCLEKYGTEYASQSEIVLNKIKQTCLDRYGKESYFQTTEWKEKSKQTNLDHWGSEWYGQTDDFKNKFKDAEWVKSIQDKSYQTKKKNNSFNTSKIEEQLQQYLTENNISYIYQYTSDSYPFNCDFYLPEKDLYVEIQGTWTHGPHPFTGSDNDMLLLEKWKSKGTDFYKSAIETWTVRDVKKRETAKQNNLNYLEIFSCDLDECIKQIMFIYK